MNLILFHPTQQVAAGIWRLDARQHEHLRKVLRAAPGTTLKAGVKGGGLGHVVLEDDFLHCRGVFTTPPPPPAQLELILALPRPLVFRRMLRTAIELGIKKIHFIATFKVEKSYWECSQLTPAALADDIICALEQCADTIEPELFFHRKFKPFVEDILPEIIHGKRFLYAHPGSAEAPAPSGPAVLAIGPEGGFTDYECGRLREASGRAISLGPRIQRSESALPILAGALLHDDF